MTEMLAVAKLLAHKAGAAIRISRQRGFPISRKPLVLIPIVMAGESPSLFGLGVGGGSGAVKTFTCANPVNRDEQYAMLAAAMAATEPTILSWEVSPDLTPQIIVTGADSARLALGVIDRSVYSHQPALVTIARRLGWFDKRSDSPDSASLLVLPQALSTCFATGQDEFGDLHLGAFLEWCAPADGRIWERVAAAEQQPASGSTSPEFDRKQLSPAVDAYNEAVKNRDARGAVRAKKTIDQLVSGEIRRRYALAVAALRLLRSIPEADVAGEIGAEDRASFMQHVEYVADPNNQLRRSLTPEMQTSEFMSREFAADRIAGLSIRSVSGAYAKAQLAGDLLVGTIVTSNAQKMGRTTVIKHTITSEEQLTLRVGDKLALLADERIVYRVEGLVPDRATGNVLVQVEVIQGKRSSNLADVGAAVTLAPPVRERAALSRARIIAWERMRALPPAIAAPASVNVTQDLAGAVVTLRGKR